MQHVIASISLRTDVSNDCAKMNEPKGSVKMCGHPLSFAIA